MGEMYDLPKGVEAPTNTLKSSQQAKISKLRRAIREEKEHITDEEKRARTELEVIERLARYEQRNQTPNELDVIYHHVNQRIIDEAARKEAEAKAIDSLSKRTAQAWVDLVGSTSTSVAITSAAQWRRIIAGAQAQLSATLVEQDQRRFTDMLAHGYIEQAYEQALQNLSRRYFTLYVDDSDAIPPMLRSRARLREFSKLLRDRAHIILRNSLKDAIDECVSGLEPNVQWPKRYTFLLYNVIRNIGLANTNIPGFKISGDAEGVDRWRTDINFFELFGDFDDLRSGFHFGALMAGSPASDERVRLPYKFQKLQNSEPQKRYYYWRALSQGKRYFYGRYKDRGSAVKGKQKILRDEHDKNMIEKQQVIKAGKNAGNRDVVSNLSTKLDYLNNRNAQIRKEHKNTDRTTRAIPIPTGAWNATVNARCNYWNTLRIAPVWLLLEFGQFVWQPIIPPRSLTFRFLQIARTRIDADLRALMDAELKAAGYMNVGTKKHPVRASGTPFMFGPSAGTAHRRGTFVSEKVLISSMQDTIRTGIRNAEQAIAIAGKMGTAPPLPAPENTGVDIFLRGLGSSMRALEASDRYYKRYPNFEDRIQLTPSVADERERAATWPAFVKLVKPISPYVIPQTRFSTSVLNFGERMSQLRKLRQVRKDIETAASVGESYPTFKARKAREKIALEKAAERAKAREAKLKLRRKQKNSTRKKK